MDLTNFFVTFFASSSLAWKLSYFAVIGMYFCRFVDFATALATGPSEVLEIWGGQVKENKSEGRSEVLLGPNDDIEFIKHFLNIFEHDKFAIKEIESGTK